MVAGVLRVPVQLLRRQILRFQFHRIETLVVDIPSLLFMMDYSNSTQLDIFDVYRRFSDIKSGNIYSFREGADMLNDDAEKIKFSREAMAQLSKMVDVSVNGRIMILDELHKLMLQLNIMADFSEFSNFYDFVFFMCRENGQKNITVGRAIAAWKVVLAGRFRLLNQWCDFVEKNQRYNISEDTWRQVLAFSRCVHEDLEGYDPEGAWPTLIDDFVEHMYRITGSNDCSSHNLTCNCGNPEDESFETPCPGLRNLPGLKRKYHGDANKMGSYMYSSCPSNVINSIINFKRRKQHQNKLVKSEEDLSGCALCEQGLQTLKVTSPLNNSKSPCAVEGCLSLGFSGLFSSPPCVENQE